MDIFKARVFVNQILEKLNINLNGIEEANGKTRIAWYNESSNKIYFNFEEIEKHANKHAMTLVEHFEIIACHEIGHVIDLKINSDYYHTEHEKCIQAMNNIDYENASHDYICQKNNDTSIRFKELDLMMEVAAWEEGATLIRDNLKEKYDDLKQKFIVQFKAENSL